MLRTTFTYLLLGTLTLEMLGYAARDRVLATTLLMYLPVMPVALMALAWDCVLRGRALPRPWLLAAGALASALVALSAMWQPALAAEPGDARAQVRLVQWNTMWGGSNRKALQRTLDSVAAQAPDIVCLSEAPNSTRLQQTWRQHHADWHLASVTSAPGASYLYNLSVLTRFPVQARDEWALNTGHAALFEITLPSRPVRALVVDLQSTPTLPRSPSIRQVARLLATRAAGGQPVDLVLGDFNTPARFLGFDALAEAGPGYRRAGLWSGQWRGTWPSIVTLPPFDIDHIWVSKRLSVVGSSFFRSRSSDHRGQRVDLRLH